MNLRAYLDSFPTTESGIVSLLREKEIKGETGSACACPIAHLLRKEGFARAAVGLAYIQCSSADKEERSMGICDRVFTPNAIARFITNFDNGTYPVSGLGSLKKNLPMIISCARLFRPYDERVERRI